MGECGGGGVRWWRRRIRTQSASSTRATFTAHYYTYTCSPYNTRKWVVSECEHVANYAYKEK